MPKTLMLYEGQTAPLHYHWSKMEDIINRGGNDVYITVFNGGKDGEKLTTDVTVHTDGRVSPFLRATGFSPSRPEHHDYAVSLP